MLAASLLLLGVAGALLIAGAALGNEDLVLASIASALAAGGLLALSLARHRPLAPTPVTREPTWSGASSTGPDVQPDDQPTADPDEEPDADPGSEAR